MKITFSHDWDWHNFSTPSIEIGDVVGYPFIMFRLFWFWFSIDIHKNDYDG